MFAPKPSKDVYYKSLPLGLIEACSLLNKKEFYIKIFSASLEKDYKQEIISILQNTSVLLFGVSAMTGYQIKEAIEIIRMVKRIKPGLPIVWGGYHASILPEQTLESEFADIVVIGQAQRTFNELVFALKNKTSLHNINGIGFKENKKIIINEPRALEDVNNFPNPDFLLLDVEDFILVNENNQRYINLCSSFGCPHRCNFCVEPIIYKRRWLAYSAENVLAQMKYLIENHNIEFFGFNDSNFFVDKERVRKICQGIINNNWDISWGDANGRTKQMLMFDKELWALMKQSGCKSILIGVESGDQESLNLICKDTTVQDTIDLANIANEFEIDLTFGLMIGLPRYPDYLDKTKARIGIKKEFDSIMDLLDKTFVVKKYQAMLIFVYTPYPANPLFEVSKQLGFKSPEKLEEWAEFSTSNLNIPWLTKQDYKKVQVLMDFVFPYSNVYYKKKHSKRFGFIHDVFHKTALWRWKHRYFDFALEHSILILFRRLRNIVQA